MNYSERFKLRDEADKLLSNEPFTEYDAVRVVEIIKLLKDDDEVAHGLEDMLREVILKNVDHPLCKIGLSTNEIEFSRWCA